MRFRIGKDNRIGIDDFSSVQAYKIAIHMEHSGIDFYRDLLSKVRDLKAKQEIEALLKDEQEHLGVFEDLLSAEKETSEDGFEEDDVVSFMNSKVFDPVLEKMKAENINYRHTALEEAVDMEIRTIIFYEGCLANSSDEKAKRAFKKIIEVEKEHARKLSDLIRSKCLSSKDGCIL